MGNISLKEAVILGLAAFGAYMAYKTYVRHSGPYGVKGVGISTQNSTDRQVALTRFFAGPKAVAESAKQALEGPDAYASKKESEAVRAS